ncbi:MAG: hypothetical protein V3T58_07840 [Candidatus Hydrothermarchaeales archaeon]
MVNLVVLLMGAVISIVLCLIWRWLRYSQIAPSITSDKKLTRMGLRGPASVEHYHWGILFGLSGFFLTYYCHLALDSLFWIGLGVILILSEFAQENPFGAGKDHFQTTNMITVVLVVVLILAWFFGHEILCANYMVRFSRLSFILASI